MDERGRMTGGGGCGAGGVVGAGAVGGGVWAAATPLASATVFRNARRPVDLFGIWCECSRVRRLEVAEFGGFAISTE